MELNFMYVVARNKNKEVVWAEPISDIYTETCMVLYKDYGLTFEDVIKCGRSVYGDRVYSAFSTHLDRFERDEKFILQCEAKDLCGKYGDVEVEIESFKKDIK